MEQKKWEDFEIIKNFKMDTYNQVTILCKSSLYRSPAAKVVLEEYIRRECEANNIKSRTILRAKALRNPEEQAMKEEMIVALNRKGYGYHRDHIAEFVTEEELIESKLVLCVKKSHVEVAKRFAPGLSGKIATISEYARFEYEEIKDPDEVLDKFKLYTAMVWLNIPANVRMKYYKIKVPEDYCERCQPGFIIMYYF